MSNKQVIQQNEVVSYLNSADIDVYEEAKEKMAFDEFKKRMKGDMESEMYEDDNLFYKFLKARDFKVDQAEKMLRQHLKWRNKYDVKNILKWNPPEVLLKYIIIPKLGYDKDGCIFKYNHFGNTDFRGVFESCTLEEWLRFMIYLFEQDVIELKRQSKKLGKTVDKVVYIENLEHFTLAKATDKKVISTMITSINMYLNNYPETMKTVYMINAPVYFNIFFAVITAFLPSTVLKKVKVYSDDCWRKDLLEVIDAEVLPGFLGGKRTDPDGNPLCLTLLKSVEPVPMSCYLNKSKRSFPTLSDAEKIKVSRASVHEVFLEVEEPGSHLEWEFEVKTGDIKFGLYYKDEDGNRTEIIPSEKVNAVEYAQSGLYKCENTGYYFIVFDNAYSFLRTKEICYKIKVRNPREQVSNFTSS